jgi:hypothetical protein
MYFTFNLLVYRFAKKFVERMNIKQKKKVDGVIYLRTEVVPGSRSNKFHGDGELIASYLAHPLCHCHL